MRMWRIYILLKAAEQVFIKAKRLATGPTMLVFWSYVIGWSDAVDTVKFFYGA